MPQQQKQGKGRSKNPNRSRAISQRAAKANRLNPVIQLKDGTIHTLYQTKVRSFKTQKRKDARIRKMTNGKFNSVVEMEKHKHNTQIKKKGKQ